MTPMKPVRCPRFQNMYFVGRNYVAHIRELQNERPDRPLIFIKPVSCAVFDGPVSRPPHTDDLHYEGEMVFVLPGNSQALAETDHLAVGCGIDFTARDVQSRIKKKGWPWFEAKCFRGSAVLSRTFGQVPITQLENLFIETWVNGEQRQSGSYRQKLFPLPELVHHLDTLVDIQEGDLLFTGTPAGVGPVQPGDRIQVRLLLQDTVIAETTCEVT